MRTRRHTRAETRCRPNAFNATRSSAESSRPGNGLRAVSRELTHSCRSNHSPHRKPDRLGWAGALVLRPMHSAPLVAKDAPCIGGGELPIDAALAAVRAGIPGASPAAEFAEGRDAVTTEAFARPKPDLDLGRVEPARVLRRVVHGEAPPQPTTFQGSEGVGERLHAVGVQVVHHEMDGPGRGVDGGDLLHGVREARSLAVARSVGQVAPALRLHDAEDVRRSMANVLVV